MEQTTDFNLIVSDYDSNSNRPTVTRVQRVVDRAKLHAHWVVGKLDNPLHGKRRGKLTTRSTRMTSLTLDTNTTVNSSPSNSNQKRERSVTNVYTAPDPQSRSTSPTPTQHAPPFSPLTPTLSSARLAGPSPSEPPAPRTSYSHTTQTPQVAISQPPMIMIDFDTNPDVIALKATMAVLLNQNNTGRKDIVTLNNMKDQALKDPEGFLRALATGEIKVRRKDPLFFPGEEDEDEEDGKQTDDSGREAEGPEKKKRKWDQLPSAQSVVRVPPINWAQYGIVGESLDKIHEDQLARPTEGVPARIMPDGTVVHGGDGARRPADLGVAAPYTPGRDKIEKMGTRKSGKR